MSSPGAPGVALIERHYRPIAFAILALAAFNLTFRLGSEVVTEWDESLYAQSAWEMVRSGHWVATTFGGALEYYNSKPPLNVWLIALSFQIFGASLVSLRIVSAVSAWLTVAVLQTWLRRIAGATVAVCGSLVLATCFGFLYAHAGRSGNTDALFALLILMTVVVLWAGQEQPWRRIWLGPLLAAVFLLKGMAVLMPFSIVVCFELWKAARRERGRSLAPLAVASLLLVTPVAAWVWARWQVDQWRFLERLFDYDLVGSTFTTLEGHGGTPLFYLDVLQRDHFDWLAAGAVAWLVCPIAWSRLRTGLWFWRGEHALRMLLGVWAAITLLVPSVMQTKLPWYLNAFYPAFAVGIGWLIARAASAVSASTRWRQCALAAAVVTAFVAAESRLLWYSVSHRDLPLSAQGALLDARATLVGRQVFMTRWDHGDSFVIRALVQAEPREASSVDDFIRDGQPGDYFVSTGALLHVSLVAVGSAGNYWVYRLQ